MLKKSVLAITAMLFATIILGVSLLCASDGSGEGYRKVLAAESDAAGYFLPYPGILPNHFLYPIKVFRDKILLFLTTDPIKRTERMLLFADKRLAAAQKLVEQQESLLAVKTVKDAENWLGQAVMEEKVAKGKGKGTDILRQNLHKATAKHAELLKEIEASFTGEEAQQIRQARQSAVEWHNQF